MHSPLGVFQTVQQPAVTSGNWTAAGFLILEIVTAATLAYWTHRKSRRLNEDHNPPQGEESITSGQATAVDSKRPEHHISATPKI